MQSGTTSNPMSAGSAALAAPTAPTAIVHGGLALLTRLTDEIARNRPGVQTTEFTLVAALLVVDVTLTALGKVPTDLTIVFGAFSAVAYQWLRNHRKDSREDSLLSLVETIMESVAALQPGNDKMDRSDAAVAPIESAVTANIAPPANNDATTNNNDARGSAPLSSLPSLALPVILAASLFLAGCSTEAVSGNVGVQIGPDGQVTGGSVGISVSPVGAPASSHHRTRDGKSIVPVEGKAVVPLSSAAESAAHSAVTAQS